MVPGANGAAASNRDQEAYGLLQLVNSAAWGVRILEPRDQIDGLETGFFENCGEGELYCHGNRDISVQGNRKFRKCRDGNVRWLLPTYICQIAPDRYGIALNREGNIGTNIARPSLTSIGDIQIDKNGAVSTNFDGGLRHIWNYQTCTELCARGFVSGNCSAGGIFGCNGRDMQSLVRAFHGSQLLVENKGLNEGGEETQNASKSNHTSRDKYSLVVGVLIICCGSALVIPALKILYEANTLGRYIAPAALLALLGAILMGHGSFYAFFGHWDELALPSLFRRFPHSCEL
jgi:hypothetical protein